MKQSTKQKIADITYAIVIIGLVLGNFYVYLMRQ